MNTFLSTRKTATSRTDNQTHKLLERGGFIQQTSSGVYSYTALGNRLLTSILDVVHNELRRINFQEVSLSTLQTEQLWKTSGRWKNLEGEMFVTESSVRDTQYAMAATSEEIATEFIKQHIDSYKDLQHSKSIYQISRKYRDDRARRGIVRTKEFRMKDAYSFHQNKTQLQETYSLTKQTYKNIFDRLDLEYVIVEADAGTIGGGHSEEFIALTEDGKETIEICEECDTAHKVESGTNNNTNTCDSCGETTNYRDGIEIGHIFQLGDKYTQSTAFDLTYTLEDGTEETVQMGCYGIGVDRLLHCLVDQHRSGSDSLDLTSSEATSMKNVIITTEEHLEVAKQIHEKLDSYNTILYTGDRHLGEQFSESDLIGADTKYIVANQYEETGQIEVESGATTKHLQLSDIEDTSK